MLTHWLSKQLWDKRKCVTKMSLDSEGRFDFDWGDLMSLWGVYNWCLKEKKYFSD